ncbi:MAG: hypothetical protein K9L87_00175 [Candidatus Omnitrophica bacterium]|jgi:acyl carrier protein|nr:hypothetical protein [Candidatus Omnitrophota bacterium]MCF7876732.1 hypothetical protein [Candidatus Omnitrophota bacterium]MCF7891465.1 hypothetical protein [Candidatus Omnitrophota bacterium]MCF7895401.1 hypothetical protein [Candidatus Omnitrophota bacterium]MCF7897163.1 hypothetical protein [Candidatus Omnitrophota bacterium]
MEIAEIQKILKDFIIELLNERNILDNTALIESGLIDSLSIIHIVLFIESRFSCKLKPFDIQIDDFQTIKKMAIVVLKKIEAKKLD